MQKHITIIEPEYLKSIHNGNYHTPTVYFHNNVGVRSLFWDRLDKIAGFIINNPNIRRETCLDFGGGSGIFLPTLCKLFKKVILVDLDPSQAILIKEKYKLDNCEILQADVFKCDFKDIDCIIAADVIEHFQDTGAIVLQLKKFMSKETFLITSLPTENWFYEFLRFLFKQEKPIDHYFGADQIEGVITNMGFTTQKRVRIPFPVLFDLFSITSWKLK